MQTCTLFVAGKETAPVGVENSPLHIIVTVICILGRPIQQGEQPLGLIKRSISLPLGVVPHGLARLADLPVCLQYLRHIPTM
jgi:hypothetical protein